MDFSAWQGLWMGSWSTWVKPEELHSQSPFVATIDTLLDGSALTCQYHAILDGEVNGYILIGTTQTGISVSWIDSWHTGGLIMGSTGTNTDSRIEASTHYTAEDEIWTWTSEYGLTDEDQMLIRHFNEGPNLEKYLGVEIRLNRAAD